VGQVNALVTEVLADLVDAIETTNDELLEEELGGDAQEEVDVEVIVISDKRLSSSTTSEQVHRGGLHLSRRTG